MDDSSSSSDEETKKRLKMAVWDVKQLHANFENDTCSTSTEKNANRSTADKVPQASLRSSKSEPEFSENYGAIQASPELKSFVAKKLTTFLDGVIREYTSDSCKPSNIECADDFRLFSTSKPHDPTTVEPSVDLKKQSKWKNDSSSDSDSDEERQKLASVAVSMEDVINSQRVLSAVAEPKPGLVITSDPSQTTKGCTNGDRMEEESKLEGLKKKKKKKKKKVDLDQSNHTDESLGELPGTVECEASHGNCKRRHSQPSYDSVEDTGHQQHIISHKEPDGENNSLMQGDLSRKKKNKYDKSSDSMSTDCNMNDANLQQEGLHRVKRKKKKKSKDMQL